MKNIILVASILLMALQIASATTFDKKKLELKVQIGHTGDVNSAVFSPDEKYILTASHDGTAKLWDVSTGRVIQDFIGHNFYVKTAEFSPDGKYILTASWDMTAKLWDIATGEIIQDFIGHTYYVNTANFSPDGKYILTTSSDKTAKLWDTTTGKIVQNFIGHTNSVESAIFSPEGKNIVTASWDSTAKLWDIATGSIVQEFIGHTDHVETAIFSPDGKYILTASYDESILWDIETGKIVQDIKKHIIWIHSALHGLLRKYGLQRTDNTVRLLDLETRKIVQDFIGLISSVCTATFSPDGKYILTSSSDSTAKLMDISTGRIVQYFIGFTSSVRIAKFSPDGKYILTASYDGTAKLWDIGTGRMIRDFIGHNERITSVSFSPDSKAILTVSQLFIAKMWDIATGEIIQDFIGHTSNVETATFSPNGKYILTRYDDYTAKLWDIATKKFIQDFIGHTDWVYTAIFSSDGNYILTASHDGTAKLWDIEIGKIVQNFIGHTSSVNTAIFSPDEIHILTSSGDSTAKLWDISTGKIVQDFIGHTRWVCSAIFSPDGKYILTASSDKTAKLWDISTGKIAKDLKGHTNFVISATFSPDGKYIVTKSEDNTMKIWSAETGKELITIIQVGESDWLHVTPDGRFDYSSDFAMSQLHYVSGMEVITLDQFNVRAFHEPGLFENVMKGEAGRDLGNLDSIWLFPEVELGKFDHNLQLDITLRNRGGGIGPVEIWVDDKSIEGNLLYSNNSDYSIQLFADGRKIDDFYDIEKNLQVNDTSIKELRILANISDFYLTPGKENKIQVKAWDYNRNISSREQTVYYTPDGRLPDSSEVKIFVLSIGVRNYNTRQQNEAMKVKSSAQEGVFLNLPYADKDARDIARAFEVGATGLFMKDNIIIKTLTTDNTDAIKQPTKRNIMAALDEIKAESRAYDILLIYYSGHGTTVGNTFYLIPKGMQSTEEFKDSRLIEQLVISEYELQSKIREIPANKVALILDACESGKIIDRDVFGKNIANSRKNTIEAIRQTSGTLILCGSAPNTPSYMASPYSQSLLALGILEGIRGGKLNINNEIEVMPLFNYVRQRVNTYAKSLEITQEPQIAGRNDFIAGRLLPELSNEIPYPIEKPIISLVEIRNMLPPNIDKQQLNATIKQELNKRTIYFEDYYGEIKFIFLENLNFPKSYQITGDYEPIGDEIRIVARIFTNDDPDNFTTIESTISFNELDKNLNEFAEKLINEVIKKFPK